MGVNAIWVSSPVEQSHGWVGGGPMGMYQYYAYHGYYALDFTSIDANMGTVEDFRTFVNEAHKRGIRVLIDVVMNHTGYATLKDMCDFNFGRTSHGEDPCKEWNPKIKILVRHSTTSQLTQDMTLHGIDGGVKTESYLTVMVRAAVLRMV